jgi:hypothetical protein
VPFGAVEAIWSAVALSRGGVPRMLAAVGPSDKHQLDPVGGPLEQRSWAPEVCLAPVNEEFASCCAGRGSDEQVIRDGPSVTPSVIDPAMPA